MKTWLLVMLAFGLAGSTSAAAPLNPSQLASISSPAGARAPMDGVFLDQQGRSVTLARLANGKPVVLVPVQHTCRNLCGLTLEQLKGAIAGQSFRPGRDFALVAFGIDPRETPKDATASEARLGGGAGVSALVGGASPVAAVTGALGYRYSWIQATRQYAHLSAVAVLSPDGRLAGWLKGLGTSPDALHAALARATSDAPYQPSAGIRILCFHFDPPSSKDARTALEVMRWSAGGTALALVMGLGLAFARERRRRRGA